MTGERPDVSVAVDAAIAFMAPICLTQDVALALDAVREMARLAEQRSFEEGQNSMMRLLREARRERDEAREQVRSLTERLNEAADRATREAQARDEAVRSLTVERDEARDHLEQAARREVALGARLSRAREALDAWDEEAPHYQCDLDLYTEWCKRQDAALAALRAALSEPPGGEPK